MLPPERRSGDSLLLKILFSPTEQGLKTVWLTVRSNDTSPVPHDMLFLPISGTGVTPVPGPATLFCLAPGLADLICIKRRFL